MVNKKRLPSGDDFSDSDTSAQGIGLTGLVTPSSPPHAASAAGEETSDMLRSRKKRKATLSSLAPDTKRLWSKDDELVILKGIVDYRNSTGVDYVSDSGAFFRYIKDDLDAKVSKNQLICKIRKLKQKFRDNLAKKPCFTNSHDSETFDLSMAIWENDNVECVDGTKSKVWAFVEHEAVKKGEPENDDGSAKGDTCDKLPSENLDKSMENKAVGKESKKVEAEANREPENGDGSAKGNSYDDKLPCENVEKRVENESAGKQNEEDGADDELCALQDALETTMFQQLGNDAQKLILQNLRTLRARERKELSDEWKALLVQETLLDSKKRYFSAKLANAAIASLGRTRN